jgi:hypothetical protein
MAMVLATVAVVTAPPAFAHGGPIGLSVLANSPSGPLQSYLRIQAVWLGDGDDADGLSVAVSGSGPGGTGASLGGGGGVYQGTIGYPVGGTWTLTVNVVGAPYEYSASPLVVNVNVEGLPTPTPPPTQATSPPPDPATTAPATTSPATPTTVPSSSPTTVPIAAGAARNVGPIVVDPKSAGRGSYSIVTFAVPNARADADVVGVEARFPAKQPLLGAQTQALAGWPATVNNVDLARPKGNLTQRVGSVSWTTSVTPLKPGQVQLYTVSIGPLPKAGSAMWVDVVQTYSDGTQVLWTERPTKAEPHPVHASARLRLVEQKTTSGAPGSH